MILLTRMDKQEMYVNPDHIISIEETPDTVIALFNGHHFIVKESASSIINRIVAFRSRITRRAGGAVSGRHLARSRKCMFRSITLNRELSYPDSQHEQSCSPFHSRES
jgi:flagellar protein FlbD